MHDAYRNGVEILVGTVLVHDLCTGCRVWGIGSRRPHQQGNLRSGLKTKPGMQTIGPPHLLLSQSLDAQVDIRELSTGFCPGHRFTGYLGSRRLSVSLPRSSQNHRILHSTRLQICLLSSQCPTPLPTGIGRTRTSGLGLGSGSNASSWR
jgi:hypothetical protein